MKPLEEQTHYEALEIPPTASAEDVERAYRVAVAAFAPESLALYSVYDGASADDIRGRIEEAYRVLRDERRRAAYDDEVSVASPAAAAAQADAPPSHAHAAATSDFEELEDEEEGDGWSGARLRRSRLQRGVEIDDVAGATKINPTYLRCIEEEAYEELPAPVYVRGFVTAYARAIGLDPSRVAGGYMTRLEEAGQAKRPGRLLSRG